MAQDPRRALTLSLQTTFLAQLLLAVSGILLARSLGQDDRGELAAAMLWPTVIAGFGTLGLSEAITYHVASEPRAVGRLVGSGLALAALQSLGFTLLAVGLIPLVLQHQGSSVVDAGLIYSAYIPLITVGVVLFGTLNGLHRYRWFNAVRLSIFVLMVCAQVILLAFGSSTVKTLVVAFVGCQAVMTLLAAGLVLRSGPGQLKCDRGTMKRIVRYGARSNAGTTSSFLNQRLDQLVIAGFLSAGQLGLYVVAVNLASVAGLIGNSVAYAALPNVASHGDGRERVLLARRLVGMALLLSTALAIPVLVFAPELIRLLFGSAFSGASDVARILAAAAIVFATTRALEAVLRGVGRPLDAGLAELVALSVTVLGLALLVPSMGIIGAGLTSLIAYAVSGAWMVFRASRALGISPFRLLIPDRAAIGAVFTLVRRRVTLRRRRTA